MSRKSKCRMDALFDTPDLLTTCRVKLKMLILHLEWIKLRSIYMGTGIGLINPVTGLRWTI